MRLLLGGGVLSQWRREEGADTIAPGGDGSCLHGAFELPTWLASGGDVRVAALANETGSDDGTELAAFPMQLDLGVRVGGEPFSVTAVVGARGAVRSELPPQSYVIAREVFATWQPDRTAGLYARAGRFAAPYGLRLLDHTAYVRRYLGYNLMEETICVGTGYLDESWELHATGFVYDPLQGPARREAGGVQLAGAA